MKNTEIDNTPAKFPWSISYYIEMNKSKGNACNGPTAAIVFYKIYFWSNVNEKLHKQRVFKNGKYWTYFTSVTLFEWFNKSVPRSTLDRAVRVLLSLGLIECMENTENDFGKLYRISDLGYELVQNDRYWLDFDVNNYVIKHQYIPEEITNNNQFNKYNDDYNDILDNLPTYD